MKLFLVACIPLLTFAFLEHVAVTRPEAGRERRRLWTQFVIGVLLGLPTYLLVNALHLLADGSYRGLVIFVRLTLADHLVPLVVGTLSFLAGGLPARRSAFLFARLAGVVAAVAVLDALWIADRDPYRLFLVPVLRIAGAAMVSLALLHVQRGQPRTLAVAVLMGVAVPLMAGFAGAVSQSGLAVLGLLAGTATLIGAGAIVSHNWEEALA